LNTNLNQNITQLQTQIANNTNQINQLQTYNTYIPEVIAYIPQSDTDLIDYQNSIATQNTATISQLTQLNTNLNQNITQLQTQIANNTNQIGVLQNDNNYITQTIAFIPSSSNYDKNYNININ
jgi:chromosome segregation ATPase